MASPTQDGLYLDSEKVRARLERLAKRFPDEAARALYQEAEVEMTEAKRRTPVDTGALRGSGHVERPDVGLSNISVALQFGGPAAPYALKVHEDLDAFHRVGQAKFLESTLMESRPYMAARIARRLQLDRMLA